MVKPEAIEFFAGIGLARLGLEEAGFEIPWSNDIDEGKSEIYSRNFRKRKDNHKFVLGDISTLSAVDIPANAALWWASFPCTDLSLAGARAGLGGGASGMFWQFTRILEEAGDSRPPTVALENVPGFASSNGGRDLRDAIIKMNHLGYSVDALTIDASSFVPQSRPRLFLVCAQRPPETSEETGTGGSALSLVLSDPNLKTHKAKLPPTPNSEETLSSVVQRLPANSPRWWNEAKLENFTASLSELQAARLEKLRRGRRVTYRTAYRRTRGGSAIWEIRADDISGCLRTALGGSSKQALVSAGRGQVRVRWMTPIEYARLMGAGDYKMSSGIPANRIISGFGDGVCVPVVSWLAREYLMPLALAGSAS